MMNTVRNPLLRRLLVVAACLVLGGFARAQDAAPPAAEAELSEQVTAHVAKLDSASKAERDAAEAALIALGRDALPLLPKPSRRMAAETVQRLERVRNALSNVGGEETLEGSRVTLSATDQPASEIFAALTAQTGNKIVDYRGDFDQDAPDPSISVEFNDAPFWQAFDEVLDKAGLTLYDYPTESDVAALVAKNQSAGDRSARAFYSGPFRLAAQRIEAVRDLRYDESTNVLRITFNVSWEPRLKPVNLTIPLEGLEILDEDGNSLELNTAMNRIDVPVSVDVASAEVELPLALPPRSAERIATIKGSLSTVILGSTEVFTFENLAKTRNQRETIGAVTVTMQLAQPVNPQIWRIFLQTEFDGSAAALESHQTWIYGNQADLLAADGAKASLAGTDAVGQSPNSIAMSYLYDVGESIDGYRLEYHSPIAVRQASFDFEINDLPLP